MKSIRIVQSGDFHLDSPLALHHLSFRKQRREELLQSFSHIIDFSIETNTDLLLLTGDLFDSSRVTQKTLDFLSREMKRFHGSIFISPGNHDPYTPDSPYETFSFPGNTHIFREYEEIYLDELNCLVCGQGFTGAYQHQNMLHGRKPVHSASFKILVMHGEVTTGTNEYNPITRESIAESGFNYIALGHRHEFSGILKEGKTSFAYAGIPEGRGFDELGDKGIIHGEVFETGTNLSFRKINKRNYSVIPVPLADAFTTSEISDRILKSIEKRSDILRIELTGKVPSYLNIDIDGITAALAGHLSYFTITDRTTVNENKEHISDNTLKGLFLKTIMERKDLSMTDHELLDEAESLGLRILSSEDF